MSVHTLMALIRGRCVGAGATSIVRRRGFVINVTPQPHRSWPAVVRLMTEVAEIRSLDFVVTRKMLQDPNLCSSFLTSFRVALLCSVDVGRSDSGRRCCDATSRVSQRFLAWCTARLAAIAISIESLFGVA